MAYVYYNKAHVRCFLCLKLSLYVPNPSCFSLEPVCQTQSWNSPKYHQLMPSDGCLSSIIHKNLALGPDARHPFSLPDDSIVSAQSYKSMGNSSLSIKLLDMPITAFMGVRISCDMFARKLCLEAAAASATSFAVFKSMYHMYLAVLLYSHMVPVSQSHLSATSLSWLFPLPVQSFVAAD